MSENIRGTEYWLMEEFFIRKQIHHRFLEKKV